MRVHAAQTALLVPTKALKTGRSTTPSTAPQPPSGGPRTAEEIAEELRAAMARAAASARTQLGANVAGRHGALDVIRPSAEEEHGRCAEGETGRGGEEGVARPGTGGEERTDEAVPEQPVGQVERTGPVPEPTEARDEGATVAESVVQPVLRPAPEVVPVVEMTPEDESEVMALRQSEGSEQIAPSTAPDAAGVAPSSEGGLDAGQGPPAGSE